MGNLAGFQAEQYEDFKAPNYDPLPVGEYIAFIDNSEIVNTTDKTGQRLKITWKVLQPTAYEGRLIFDGVMLSTSKTDEKSTKSITIGQKQLSSICKACGILHPNDSSELHGIACRVKVRIQPGNNGYGPRNNITEYHSCSAGATIAAPSTPTATPPVQAAQPAPKTGPGAKPAWMQNR